MGAALIHANGRTDGRTAGHEEAIWPFSKLCERAKMILAP